MIWRTLKSIIGFMALVFVLCFVLAPVVVGAIANNYGTANGLVAQVVGPIPFGPFIYALVANTVCGLLGGSCVNVADNDLVLSFDTLTTELIKTLFAVVIFAMLRIAGRITLNSRDEINGWTAGGRLVFLMAAALISANLAPFVIDYACVGCEIFHDQVAAIVSTQIPVAMLDVGALFLVMLLAILVIRTVFYMLMRFLLVNIARLLLAYALVLSYLVSIQCQLYMPILQNAGTLFVIILVLGAAELVLDITLK